MQTDEKVKREQYRFLLKRRLPKGASMANPITTDHLIEIAVRTGQHVKTIRRRLEQIDAWFEGGKDERIRNEKLVEKRIEVEQALITDEIGNLKISPSISREFGTTPPPRGTLGTIN
jgi:hypothetical protein